MVEGEASAPVPAANAAMGLATSAAAGEVPPDDMRLFVREQTRLAQLQSQSLIEQNAFELSHLRFRRFSDWAKFALELSAGLVVLLIVCGIAVTVWNAANHNGLVIEAFSVPPDLASRGLTGEVTAGKVLDRLTSLQAQTLSNRAASSYVNNWGFDIKVQIPQTGVSIGELDRYLAQWLGHETHIAGEIYRDEKGLAVTARVGGQPAITVHGSDAELDRLIQQSAEAVYRTTQPYRFAVYLDDQGRGAEAAAIYRTLVSADSIDDRAWAYIGLSAQANAVGDEVQSSALLRKAMAIKPDIPLIYSNLADDEGILEHDEPSLAYTMKAIEVGERGARDTGMDDIVLAAWRSLNKNLVAQAFGDYAAGLGLLRRLDALPDDDVRETAWQLELSTCGELHDRACADAVAERFAPAPQFNAQYGRATSRQQADLSFGNWADVIAQGRVILSMLQKLPFGSVALRGFEYPILAAAYAERGDFKAAQRLIGQTPADCDICVRTRGRVAGRAHRWGAGDYWFKIVSARTPHIPFAQTDWGEMLLRKGDFDGAIAKFTLAHAKGPHYADPLELWGEALMAKNRSDLALAKFEEANKYAPNWGRLHLKWGEALYWSGDKAGAQKQFAIAARLGPSAAEKAELAWDAAHGR